MTREEAIAFAQRAADRSGRTYYAVQMYRSPHGWSFGITLLKSYFDSVEVRPKSTEEVKEAKT